MIHVRETIWSIRTFTRKIWRERGHAFSVSGGFLLMAMVLGSLALMHINLTGLLKVFQLAGFFALGWVHRSSLRSLHFLTKTYFLEYLYYYLVLAAIITVVLSIVYYLTDSDILMGIASGFAFLLPFFLAQAWFYYKHIPKGVYPLWTSQETEPTEISRYYHNKIDIRFKLSHQFFDTQEWMFPVTVSTWVGLGVLFNQFAAHYNEQAEWPIDLKDESGTLYGWEFFAESLQGFYSRQLDPQLDVKKNKIMRSEIIAARRVCLSDLRPRPPVKETLLPA